MKCGILQNIQFFWLQFFRFAIGAPVNKNPYYAIKNTKNLEGKIILKNFDLK